jgi:hypothetical protein
VLRVLVHFVPLARSQGVLVLSFHIAAGDLNRIQLVAADSTSPQLLLARGGIEGPRAPALHYGDRERPVFVPDNQKRAIARLRIEGHAHLLACLRREFGGALPVLRVLARQHNVFTIGTEQFDESSRIELFGCGHKGPCRLLW